MAEYVVFKRYEKRTDKGKLPEIIKLYVAEGLPHIELTENVEQAERFTKTEAQELAYITCMDYSKE